MATFNNGDAKSQLSGRRVATFTPSEHSSSRAYWLVCSSTAYWPHWKGGCRDCRGLTRDRKEVHSSGEVMAAHRKLAADFGHQADAVVRAARERQQHQEKPTNSVDRFRESMTFSRDKNLEGEAVVDEWVLIRDGFRRGMGDVTYAQVRGNLNARIASGGFQTVDRAHMPGRQFTTAKAIAAEHEIVSPVRITADELVLTNDSLEEIQITFVGRSRTTEPLLNDPSTHFIAILNLNPWDAGKEGKVFPKE